jgi:hypothetical protein
LPFLNEGVGLMDGINRFAQYFMDFCSNVWEQIKSFFVAFYNIVADVLVRNHISNFRIIGEYADKFTVLSWILFVFIEALICAFLVLLVWKIVQLLSRWLKFRRKEVDKEDLLIEIAKLKTQVVKVTREKDRILSLQLGSGGGLVDTESLNLGPSLVPSTALDTIPDTTEIVSTTESKDELAQVVSDSRFSKLILVDEKYKNGNYVVTMTAEDMVGLPELVARFVNYSASQHKLFYTPKTISKYVAGLATSKIIILEGISGTGKTSLPYAFSRFLKNQAVIVSVQPSWRDRTEILGYLNEFTKKFNETDFLKAVYEVSYREDVNTIVLDELNLARIEYYFAEFLSVMEMPDISEWKLDLVPTQLPGDPKHLNGGKLLIPQNVWYVGTANRDDSTFTITDKVYDRAITIYLNERAKYFDAPYTEPVNISYDYLEKLFSMAAEKHPISLKALQNLDKIDVFIQDNFKIAFGNRILKQIRIFVPVYVACGNTETEGLDFMICTKILKKFEALNLPFLRKELEELISLIQKLFGKDAFTESIAYLRDLLKMAGA